MGDLCVDGMREERDAAIAERDCLAAQLAAFSEQAGGPEVEAVFSRLRDLFFARDGDGREVAVDMILEVCAAMEKSPIPEWRFITGITHGTVARQHTALKAQRDDLAARLAQAEERAQRLEAECTEAITLISTWRESFQNELSKRCDVGAQLNALRGDYHALVSRARGLEEQAQLLETALRRLTSAVAEGWKTQDNVQEIITERCRAQKILRDIDEAAQ